jgi:hypothetical protein
MSGLRSWHRNSLYREGPARLSSARERRYHHAMDDEWTTGQRVLLTIIGALAAVCLFRALDPPSRTVVEAAPAPPSASRQLPPREIGSGGPGPQIDGPW